MNVSRAPTAFDLDFRRLLVPRLQRLIRAEALCVSRDVETFSGACSAVLAYARKYGAIHLSPGLLDELIEWIQLELLAHIDDLAPPGVGLRR